MPLRASPLPGHGNPQLGGLHDNLSFTGCAAVVQAAGSPSEVLRLDWRRNRLVAGDPT